MNNYKITIEYDGSNYFGWQKQNRTDKTIQENLEKAINILLKENINITGAGRTDTGVHAYNQIANFRTAKLFDTNKFLYSINGILPYDIIIKSIKKVNAEFHSRFSAKMREYIYNITTSNKAISRNYYYKLNYSLDFKTLEKFLDFLKSNNYYKSLCKNKSDKHNFESNIDYIGYKHFKKKGEIIFKIRADRFLHSMARAVIGCSIDVARGKVELHQMINKIKKGEILRITYLPGNALFLNQIYY